MRHYASMKCQYDTVQFVGFFYFCIYISYYFYTQIKSIQSAGWDLSYCYKKCYRDICSLHQSWLEDYKKVLTRAE